MAKILERKRILVNYDGKKAEIPDGVNLKEVHNNMDAYGAKHIVESTENPNV